MPVTLPVAEIREAVTLPVAEICEAVMLAALTSSVLTDVDMLALPATRLPVASTVSPLTTPVDTTLPDKTFPTAETLPVTATVVNVPTLVMLGCAFVVTVAADVAKAALEILPDTVPIMLLAVTLPTTLTLDPVIPPPTVKLVSVPTRVILG